MWAVAKAYASFCRCTVERLMLSGLTLSNNESFVSIKRLKSWLLEGIYFVINVIFLGNLQNPTSLCHQPSVIKGLYVVVSLFL